MPVIINITPVPSLPLLLGLEDSGAGDGMAQDQAEGSAPASVGQAQTAVKPLALNQRLWRFGREIYREVYFLNEYA